MEVVAFIIAIHFFVAVYTFFRNKKLFAFVLLSFLCVLIAQKIIIKNTEMYSFLKEFGFSENNIILMKLLSLCFVEELAKIILIATVPCNNFKTAAQVGIIFGIIETIFKASVRIYSGLAVFSVIYGIIYVISRSATTIMHAATTILNMKGVKSSGIFNKLLYLLSALISHFAYNYVIII